jgi:hypothetical protein
MTPSERVSARRRQGLLDRGHHRLHSRTPPARGPDRRSPLTGAAIRLITDGDVAGVMHCAEPDVTGIDMYMGSGGAPEGVLAAAALKCMGGQFYGKLLFRNDDERARARKAGITNFDRVYTRDDLVTRRRDLRRHRRHQRLDLAGDQARTGLGDRDHPDAVQNRLGPADDLPQPGEVSAGPQPPAFLGIEASATGRRWVGPSVEADRLAEAMAQETRLPRCPCRMLAARGVAPRTPRLPEPQLRDLLPDPRTLKDMAHRRDRLFRPSGANGSPFSPITTSTAAPRPRSSGLAARMGHASHPLHPRPHRRGLRPERPRHGPACRRPTT